jgi:hypothetical protein
MFSLTKQFSVVGYHVKKTSLCLIALLPVRVTIDELVHDYGDAVAEEFCGEVSHWYFLFCIKGFRFTLDALLCNFSKFTTAKSLTVGLKQFLNSIVINILQSRFIGQFYDVLDD